MLTGTRRIEWSNHKPRTASMSKRSAWAGGHKLKNSRSHFPSMRVLRHSSSLRLCFGRHPRASWAAAIRSLTLAPHVRHGDGSGGRADADSSGGIGHRDITTIQRYADYAPNDREVEMVDRAFGDRTRE